MKHLQKIALILILLIILFMIKSCKELTPPVVTTFNVSEVTQTTAISGGDVKDDGGSEVIKRGLCWGTGPNPTTTTTTTASDHSRDGAGTGIFTSYLTGLTANTRYYVRAWALNSQGISYGNEVSFTTNPILLAALTTTAVSMITATNAIAGGNVTSDGGGAISARGICWNLMSNPTISGNKTNDGNGIGIFISSITGLQHGTTYYVRSYATNNAGTAYGDQVCFTTNCISPDLISPGNNGVLDNGCNGIDEIMSWFFDWSNCPNATSYNLYVKYPGAKNPTLDIIITDSEYLFSQRNAWIAYQLRLGWTWKVRALLNGEWGEWSNDRIFNVEPLNTDCFPKKVNDIDGNEYNTVIIRTQLWMKENLRTTKYNDGSFIYNIRDNTEWSNLKTPGYCWFNNDSASNKNIFGGLYNWYAVNTGKLCPVGWHVPTDTDWTTLINEYLSGMNVAGGKLKEAGTEHWASPNYGATNETDFTALPGGFRYSNGLFGRLREVADFWSSSENSTSSALDYGIDNLYEKINRDSDPKNGGFSIRCIKDY